MSDNVIQYIGKGLQWLLGGIGLLFFVFLVLNGEEITNADPDAQAWVDRALYLTYVLGIICIGVITIAGIFFLVTRFRKNISLLIGLGVFGLIVAIGYGMGSDDISIFREIKEYDDTADTELTGMSKWIDAGLMTFYILTALSILLILAGWVRRLIFLR